MIEVAESEDVIPNRVKRQLTFDGADLECDPRHAVDDAGGLVLADGRGTVLAHGEKAACAVAAHPSEDHTNRVCAGGFRDRREQDIDRGPMSADEVAFAQPASQRSRADEFKMGSPARCEIDLPDFKWGAFVRLGHLSGAEAVQSRRKALRSVVFGDFGITRYLSGLQFTTCNKKPRGFWPQGWCILDGTEPTLKASNGS